METMFKSNGTHNELRVIAKQHANSLRGVVLGEVGREASVSFIKYGGSGVRTRFTMHAFFTGASSQFILSIVDETSDCGALSVYLGEWNCCLAMMNAARSINNLFPALPYKQRRGILKEIGKLMYVVLSEFDSQSRVNLETPYISAEMTIDKYGVLTDLEWIEEMMDVNHGAIEYRVLIEKNSCDSDYIVYIPAIRKGTRAHDLEEVLQEAKILILESVQEAFTHGQSLPLDISTIETICVDVDALRAHSGGLGA